MQYTYSPNGLRNFAINLSVFTMFFNLSKLYAAADPYKNRHTEFLRRFLKKEKTRPQKEKEPPSGSSENIAYQPAL